MCCTLCSLWADIPFTMPKVIKPIGELMSAGKPHHPSFIQCFKAWLWSQSAACVAKNWLHSWTVNRQSHTKCIPLQMYGVVIPDFLMNCWRDTPQQKHPHQTGIQKRCLVAKEPEHWFQHTFFCTAQIMHQWKQSEYHHPVGFKTVQWEEFNTDLLCDCTYLWAGRACSAITAVWTDSTHSTQLILQESVLIYYLASLCTGDVNHSMRNKQVLLLEYRLHLLNYYTSIQFHFL